MASLEESINACTAAVTRLADMMAKGGVPAAAVGEKKGPGRPPKPAEPALTIDQVKVVAAKVKNEKGGPVYFNFIKQFGASQLADLDKSKYGEFVAAAEVLLAEQAEEEEPAGDGL